MTLLEENAVPGATEASFSAFLKGLHGIQPLACKLSLPRLNMPLYLGAVQSRSPLPAFGRVGASFNCSAVLYNMSNSFQAAIPAMRVATFAFHSIQPSVLIPDREHFKDCNAINK